MDVGEPGGFHPLLLQTLLNNLERAAERLATLDKQARPAGGKGRVLRDGTVVAEEDGVELAALHPPAGLAGAVSLAEQRLPVGDGAGEVPHVHEVEVVLIPGPLFGTVVYLEAEVGRHPLGLHGREVGADDLAVGELVGEVAGKEPAMNSCRLGVGVFLAYMAQMPVTICRQSLRLSLDETLDGGCREGRQEHTGACANVQHLLYIRLNRSQEQLVVQQEGEVMMPVDKTGESVS